MEIILTYMPSDDEKERICGHTFEVMDYFLLLYDNNIKSTILIQENIPKEKIFQAWEDKYILPEDYKKHINFSQKNIILSTNVLVFTGGLDNNYLSTRKLIYKKLIVMRCNPYVDYSNILNNNVILLEDKRVYKQFQTYLNTIHYIKKIYFNRYKTLGVVEEKTLVYINSNLRKIDYINPDYLYVSGDKLDKNYSNYNNILIAPVQNLFEKFNTFLYTGTTRQFDCSPRFVVECAFYGKKIQFDFDFNNYAKKHSGDSGLYWRMFDIKKLYKSTYLRNLSLTKNDKFLELIK